MTISYQAVLGEEPPPTEPQTKEDCKKGGWKEFGFKNQGVVHQGRQPPKLTNTTTL